MKRGGESLNKVVGIPQVPRGERSLRETFPSVKNGKREGRTHFGGTLRKAPAALPGNSLLRGQLTERVNPMYTKKKKR